MAKFQGLEDGRELVTTEVAEQASAEVPPVAPGPGVIRRMIWPLWCRAKPEVPVQAIGNGRRFGRPAIPRRRRPESRGRPDHHLAHAPNRAGRDQLACHARFLRRLTVISKLRGDLGLARLFRHKPRLVNRVCQRLLAIHMLPHLQRGHRDDRVQMVRRGDRHRIHILPGQQFAIIRVGATCLVLAGAFLLRIGLIDGFSRRFPPAQTLLLAGRPVPGKIAAAFAIHVADGHDLHLGRLLQGRDVLHSLSAEANAGERGFRAGWNMAFAAENKSRDDRQADGSGRRSDERSTRRM